MAATTKKAPAKKGGGKKPRRNELAEDAPQAVRDLADLHDEQDEAGLFAGDQPDEDTAQHSPIGPDGEIRPVQIGKRGRAGQKMVTIFTLDGRDYRVPERLGPAAIIKFQKDLRKRGRDHALWELMLTLLGQEALDRLAESPDVSVEDVADVFAIVAHIAFGSLEKLREASDPS